MRFFSNDSNDDAERSNVDVQSRNEQLNPEQAHDDDALPDHVQSDPVAVPQQRTGSPWSDAPGSASDAPPPPDAVSEAPAAGDTVDRTDTEDAELADRERTDGTEEAGAGDEWGTGGAHRVTESDLADRSDVGDGSDIGDRPDVAAGADLGDRTDRSDVGDRSDLAEGSDLGDRGDVADRSDLGGGSDLADRTDLEDRSDVADRSDDAADAALEDRGTFEDPQVRDTAADTDTPGGTDTAAGTGAGTTTTYGPDGSVVTEDERLDSATAASDADTEADVDRLEGEPALKDEGGFDDPTAVDPVTERPLDTDTADTSETAPAADTAAAADAVPVPVGTTAVDTAATDTDTATMSKPGTVAEPETGSLFAASDAQDFHDRWRDVQLRFVDSPKEATAEAARLVEEAVDRLTAGLKSRTDAVTHETDDTEHLRVALRSYRDILNRVVAL